MVKCLIPSCVRNSRTCKMCDKHYRRWRKNKNLVIVEDDSKWNGMRGKHLTLEQKKHMSNIMLGRKGVPHTEQHKKYMSELMKGENNPMWKGNKISYTTLHSWVRRNIPQPDRCKKCGKKTNNLDASNNSGKYKREVGDWEYLCRKCHVFKDRNKKGSIISSEFIFIRGRYRRI